MRPLRVALALATALLAGAVAAPGRASTETETFVTLIGDPNDNVLSGRKLFFHPGNAAIGVDGGPSAIQVSLEGGNLGLDYEVRFDAPQGETLRVGEYDDTAGFPEAGRAGLNVSGDGRGCGASASGRFRVLQLTTGPDGSPSSVWIVFEMHCASEARPPVLGEVRYRIAGDGGTVVVGPRLVRWPDADPLQHDMQVATAVVVNPSTVPVAMGEARLEGPAATEFQIRLDDCAGHTLDPGEACMVWLRHLPASAGQKSATLVVPEASGVAHVVSLEGFVFGGTTRFAVASSPRDPIGLGDYYDYAPQNARIHAGGTLERVHASVVGLDGVEWSLSFRAPPGEQLEAGRRYTDVASTWEPREGVAAMEVSAHSTGCGGDSTGAFTVSELEAEGTDDMRRLGISFEYACGGYGPMRGILDYRVDQAHDPPEAYPGRYRRFVSIRFAGTSIAGTVSGSDQPRACIGDVPVVIEKRRRDGSVAVVGRTRTDFEGTFVRHFGSLRGTYRARAPREVLAPGSICEAARSRFRSR